MDEAQPAPDAHVRPQQLNFIEDVIGEDRLKLGLMLEGWIEKATRLGWEAHSAQVAIDMFLISVAWDHLLFTTGDQVFNQVVYTDPTAPQSTLTTQ